MDTQYEKVIAGIAVVLIIVVAIGWWSYAHRTVSMTPVTPPVTTPVLPVISSVTTVLAAPMLSASDMASWKTYTDGVKGFSIKYPSGWTVNTTYTDSVMGPGKERSGVSFTIPKSMTTGTNLGWDTSVSVETNTYATTCSASEFYGTGSMSKTFDAQVNGAMYNFATGSDAGAGNRYETFFATMPGTNPCLGVQLFIHSSNIDNYDPGTVQAFDRTQLLSIYETMLSTFTHK